MAGAPGPSPALARRAFPGEVQSPATGIHPTDRGGAVAVPVSDHGDPAGLAITERSEVRGAGTVAVLQIPGGRGGVKHANGRDAVPVPVADNRGPPRSAEGKGSEGRSPR